MSNCELEFTTLSKCSLTSCTHYSNCILGKYGTIYDFVPELEIDSCYAESRRDPNCTGSWLDTNCVSIICLSKRIGND